MDRESFIALCQFELISENGKNHHYKCKACGFEIDSIFQPAQVRRVCDVVRLPDQPDQLQELESAEGKSITDDEKRELLQKRKRELVREYLQHPPRRPCNCGGKKPPQR
jgi:hypothetical protein